MSQGPSAILDPTMGANGSICIMTGASFGILASQFTMSTSHFDMPVPTNFPLRVTALVTLTSGSATLTCDVNSTGTYSSATGGTTALSGTAEQSLSVSTTAANPYAVFRIAATTAVIANLEILARGRKPDNWDWESIEGGFNAMAAQVLDGTYLTTAGN